jgi:hypothetical protein
MSEPRDDDPTRPLPPAADEPTGGAADAPDWTRLDTAAHAEPGGPPPGSDRTSDTTRAAPRGRPRQRAAARSAGGGDSSDPEDANGDDSAPET